MEVGPQVFPVIYQVPEKQEQTKQRKGGWMMKHDHPQFPEAFRDSFRTGSKGCLSCRGRRKVCNTGEECRLRERDRERRCRSMFVGEEEIRYWDKGRLVVVFGRVEFGAGQSILYMLFHVNVDP
ncbi:hypothetical protein R1flu_022988 [Riccia fluitans]|uniref:Uncharacterized protein n=1 Tax=Riccia fluitans TaxID=41844 RepID=A0ABD1XTQ5_9MARC